MPELQIQQTEVPVDDGTKITLHWAAPADAHPAPGIIVFQEAFGVNAHIRDVVLRFARQGYFAAAPELFHRTAKHFDGSYTDFPAVAPHYQAVTQATLEADTRATHNWLRSQPNIAQEKIAAIGFCLGGRASFVANAILPLRAAISFYGGGIVPDLLPLAARQHGPILLIWGGLDKHIPPTKTRALSDALTAAGKTHVHVEFSNADHAFFCDVRSQYQPTAAKEAWEMSLTFLKNRM